MSLIKGWHRRLAARGLHLRRLARLAWLPTVYHGLRLGQGTRLFVFPNTQISVRGSVEIAPTSRLCLNEPWFFANAEPGTLIVSSGATLQVSGGEFSIKSGCYIDLKDGSTLELQGGSGYASRNLQIECRERITIGPGCAIGSDVIIRDCDGHPLTIEGYRATARVVLGSRVWVGARCVILKGVSIGDGAVLAAGSVVTRDVPPRCLAAGVPARVVRKDVSWN